MIFVSGYKRDPVPPAKITPFIRVPISTPLSEPYKLGMLIDKIIIAVTELFKVIHAVRPSRLFKEAIPHCDR
ncbi:hypothetical protein Alches_20850 [Alicyclobacillus hesperidum subsp. aegles]|nr:hypothetical protein Alches_20850 [Alicyclobacillus hesperidum subsp. aegles]